MNLAFFLRQSAFLILVFVVSLLAFEMGFTVGFDFGVKEAQTTGREAFHASEESLIHPTLRGYCVRLDSGDQHCVARPALDALVKASAR